MGSRVERRALADAATLSALRLSITLPRRCKTNVVAHEAGECLACFAANGEACKFDGIVARLSASA